MLNGRQIVDEGIVTFLSQDEELREKQIQQVGVDLRVLSIEQARGPLVVPHDHHPHCEKAMPIVSALPVDDDAWGYQYYDLAPGWYHVTFEEGCNIPDNLWLQIRQRSTFLRAGTLLCSSVFDPGFVTRRMGTVFHVFKPGITRVYIGARFAQAVVHHVNPVAHEDLYGSEQKGSSYQNDKQRDAEL